MKNFRSITAASELPLYDFSILIGPNNEGKSNLLRALVMSLKLLELKVVSGSLLALIHYLQDQNPVGIVYFREVQIDLDQELEENMMKMN